MSCGLLLFVFLFSLPFMSDPLTPCRRARFPRSARLALLAGLPLLICLLPRPAAAEVLYTIETKCSLKGATPVPCTVEAVNEAKATLYRHRIGSTVHTVRVSSDPSNMAIWDAASKSWQNLRSAEARFSTNTVCFNNRDLCVVNANYLNSLLEDRPDLRGRDYVRAHFGPTGRVDVICYDGGCDLLAQRLQGVAP